MASVATSWVLSKGCWPILGLNSEKRVEESLAALTFMLTQQETEKLEASYRPRKVEGM